MYRPVLALVVALGMATPANAAVFLFADQVPGAITHSANYDGTGGQVNISVGILTGTANANLIEISVRNIINTWNRLEGKINNIQTGTFGSQFDFESTALHELGHALGLGHPNLASESGLAGNDRRYSATTRGANGVFNLNDGADNVIGTADDLRGDDVNIFYYETADNNPFDPNPAVIDRTTFRDTVGGAGEATWVNTSTREAAAAMGFANTESVMTQGIFNNEIKRELTFDDVAGIRYAMAGFDELQGTADDYTLNLNFAGLVSAGGADIVISFNNVTSFAVANSSATFTSTPDHLVILESEIFFNSTVNWFFNQELNSMTVPEPSSFVVAAGILGIALLGHYRRRRRTS